MKEKILINSVRMFFLGFIVVFMACEQEDKTFQGDPIVAFESASENLIITQVDPQFNVEVMLVGPQFPTEKKVNFKILDEYEAASGNVVKTTLQEGKEIENFATNTITFSPNTSLVEIPINFNFDEFVRDSTYRILFELEDGDLGVSEKANSVINILVTPHRVFVPDDFIGEISAEHTSNYGIDEFPVILEYDSSDASNRVHYMTIDGVFGLNGNPWTSESHGETLDVQKIKIVVDDSDYRESIVKADAQYYMTFSEDSVVFAPRTVPGSFNTWEKAFSLPAFDLRTLEEERIYIQGSPFYNRDTNIRIKLLYNEE